MGGVLEVLGEAYGEEGQKIQATGTLRIVLAIVVSATGGIPRDS